MASMNPPSGPARLIPYLVVRDASRAIDFYTRIWGAIETIRLDLPGGNIAHAELDIAGARVAIADEYPELDVLGPATRGGTTVSLILYVDDVDSAVERALAAGATLERPISNEFHGDRMAWVRDPFGHRWALATRIEEVSVDEMKRRFAAMMAG